MSSKFQNDAIFWVEVEKINPNPYQPRRDFNEERLRDLAESIRQYGILQPLTVTRNEKVKDDGGLKVQYELIAGERRHRAAQMANLSQVPVIIRSGEEDKQAKLELAIIENLQREDLNPIERAEAFDQLADEFDFTHKEIAGQIGKSREYVSNSMRLLKLPEKIKQAIINGKMTEGHARPIMMLRDKPEEQETLFKEVIHKGLTVREAESIARRDAQDKVRKKENKIDPETKALEEKLSDTFGTRVKIEERDVGGKLVIDFFSEEDLENIVKLVQNNGDIDMGDMMEQYVSATAEQQEARATDSEAALQDTSPETASSDEVVAEDEASEGKSMAETLGSMIAAARQQAKSKDGGPQENVPDEEKESLQSDDTQTTSPATPTAEEEQVQVSEETDNEGTASAVVSTTEKYKEDSEEAANEEVSVPESETRSESGTDSDQVESTSTSNKHPDEVAVDSVDQEDNSAEAEEPEKDQDITEETDTADEENLEAGSEDEMYSVSNFSI